MSEAHDESEDALVPVGSTDLAETGATGVDAYEREYMPGAGQVLARHRMVAGWKFNAFLAVVAGIVAVPGIVAGQLWASAITLATLALMWVFMGVLRVNVSEQAVNVKYMMFGPTIPVSSIISVEPIRYTLLNTGGWGIRWKGDGWMYNMMGDGGRAVRIVWRKPSGAEAVTYVGLQTADQLARDIQAAVDRLAAQPRLDGASSVPAALSSADEAQPQSPDQGDGDDDLGENE